MSKGTQQTKTEVANNAGWMLTFADLLSLLLTFFVLVFSMSTLNVDSWKDVVDTMRDQFNPNYSAITQQRFENTQAVARRAPQGLNLNYLKALIERDIAQYEGLEQAQVRQESDRVIISVPASSWFQEKSAQFRDQGPRAIMQLAGSLLQIRNRLLIAGHTNDLPVENRRFPSNWELSLTRAQLVAGVLVDAGYIQPITVLGHGDSKFSATVDGRVTVDRLDEQERIDFVLLGERRSNGVLDVF